MAKKKAAAAVTPAKKRPVRFSLPEMRCFLACDNAGRATVSGAAKKTFLIGLFDTVAATGLPAAFGPCMFFVQLFGGSGECTAKIVGSLKDGTVAIESSAPIDLSSSDKKELFLQLPIMALPKFGPITFRLYLNDERVGWDFVINFKKATRELQKVLQ